ncbi:MAG: PepSY domain-containing protein [Proteobacteria bacterium]|nr:PepSY domain-containing protein [Pseudomonadota bacterium]
MTLALISISPMAFGSSAPTAKSDKADRKKREQAAIREALRRGEFVPLPRILANAQARVRGEILKVEIEQESWGFKYEVKILSANGRVREVQLNARTGAVVAVEDD